MLEHVYYRSGICLVSALVLLTVVMSTPLLPARMGSKSFQIVCQMRNYGTRPTPSTRHCFKRTADGNMADSAEFGRAVETEKVEECFAGVTGTVSFLFAPPLSTSLKRPAKQTKAFGLMQLSPMLRC